MTSTTRKILTGAATAAAATALAVTGAATASAQQFGSFPLSPGQGACGPAQYASSQVRADGWATAGGAKFKLLRNGYVVANTPSRVNAWSVQLSGWTFPGAGFYTVCAQNTGTTNTVVSLQLRTDGEF